MELKKLQDKCRGSIVGGAVGDALGYEVEFKRLSTIYKEYGDRGITRYTDDADGVEHFSDDTQMTLFTLEGLMNGVVDRESMDPSVLVPYIEKAYLSWYSTQTGKPQVIHDSCLSHIKALWANRAPGNTCMSALQDISAGFEASNNSKGCGGVMRVAPIGLFYAIHPEFVSYADNAHLAGRTAEITHKHPASTLAAALASVVVANCMQVEEMDSQHFRRIVEGAMKMMDSYFPEYKDEVKKFRYLIKLTIELADSDRPDAECIREIGEGWVGDEAIAIALFSVMRHIDSFEDCMVCAVNHDGDSDSTGAIAGNIIGAIQGYSGIPSYYLKTLEIEPVLKSLADDLCCDPADPSDGKRLFDRYVKHIPAGVSGELILINS